MIIMIKCILKSGVLFFVLTLYLQAGAFAAEEPKSMRAQAEEMQESIEQLQQQGPDAITLSTDQLVDIIAGSL